MTTFNGQLVLLGLLYIMKYVLYQLPQFILFYFFFQIREETDTKIDLPSEISESDVITITGKKANVEKAQAKIEAIQKEMVRTNAYIFSISFTRSPILQ